MAEQTTKPAFTVTEAINKGFELTQKHWQKFLLLIIGAIIVFGCLSALSSAVFNEQGLGQLLVQLTSLVLSSIATIALIRFTLNTLDGKPTTLEVLLKLDWKMILSITLFSLLYGLGVVLGLFAFIVPGIILATGWYFAQYLIVDKKTDVLEAFKLSWRMSRGSRGRIFLFAVAIAIPAVVLSLVILALVGSVIMGAKLVLPSIVGVVLFLGVALLTEMVSSFGLAYIYRKLESKHHAS